MTTIAFGKVNSDKKLIFVLLCLGNITISFNTGAVAAAIPLIGQDLHQPDFVVSKIVVFYMIPYGLGALLYAPLTRILSYRLILVIASLSYAFFSLLSGLSHSLDTILWAQIGAGIAAASSTPLSLMIIGELFDKDMRGRLVGGYLSDKKGRLIACFAGIFILALGTMLLAGHYYLFAIPIILGLISMGWTINHNSVSTILTDFPDDDRPIMASLNSAVRFISGGLGFSLSRVFVEKSFPLTFLGIGILFFLVSLIIKRVIPALETGRPRQGAKYEGRFDG